MTISLTFSICGLQDRVRGTPFGHEGLRPATKHGVGGEVHASILPAHPCETPQNRFARTREEAMV